MAKSLIIDPGHGGTDSGAVGNNTKEKEWTFIISLYEYERLKELGANVAITRNRDRSLTAAQRTDLVKDKYDYCMSNHWNAFNGSARGVETIYSIHSNGVLAKKIAAAIVDVSGLPLRRVFNREGSRGKDYYFMHRETGRTDTIIVEHGFIDNKHDFDFYNNPNNMFKVAEAVIEVWCGVLGVVYKPREKKAAGQKKTLYRVQVGAFSDLDNANDMVKRLEKAGFSAFINKA